MSEEDALFDRLAGRLRVEHGLVAGDTVSVGLVLRGIVFAHWISRSAGDLSDEYLAVVSATRGGRGDPGVLRRSSWQSSRLRRAADPASCRPEAAGWPAGVGLEGA